MLRLTAWITAISRVAVWTGGASLIVSALIVATDVALRNLFAVTLGGADEIAGYLFGISTSWALSYTLLQRGNVRIDALYGRLANRGRGALDLLGLSLLATFAGTMTFQGAAVVSESVRLASRSITPLQMPLALPQVLWLAGWALLLATCVLLLVRAGLAFAHGRIGEVEALVGLPDAVTLDRSVSTSLLGGDSSPAAERQR